MRQSRLEVILMPGILVRDEESFEGAIRRFKKQCEKAGILSEVKKRENSCFYYTYFIKKM